MPIKLKDIKGSNKKGNKLYAVTFLDDENNGEYLRTETFAAKTKAQLKSLVRKDWLDELSDSQYGMEPSMRLSNRVYFDNNMWGECVLHEEIGTIN